MLSISCKKALVAYNPIDFRKGIDGLIRICQYELEQDTRNGTAFVFCNQARNAIKVLVYDGQGYWVCHKRFSEGRIRNWPKAADDAKLRELQSYELMTTLFDGDLQGVNFKKIFCKIS